MDKRDLDLFRVPQEGIVLLERKIKSALSRTASRRNGTSVRNRHCAVRRRVEGPQRQTGSKRGGFYAQQHQETRRSPSPCTKLSILVSHSDCHFTKSASWKVDRNGISDYSGAGTVLSNSTSLRGQRHQQSPELLGHPSVLRWKGVLSG